MTAGPEDYASMLVDIGACHPNVVVIDAGLGSSMQTQGFARRFPSRYFNLGIAEQNAVGVASGLARRGFVPLVHTFSNFLARRAHDQVALSVAWARCDVKMIGGSCGLFDGRNGPSHLASDDLAVMSALPEVFIAEPGDQRQLWDLLRRVIQMDGPAYLRLRRHGAPRNLLPERDGIAGTAVVHRAEGAMCTVVAGGSMLGEASLATDILVDRGVPVDLIHVSVLRPLEEAPVVASANRTGLVVIIENHGPVGGYGEAVSRILGPLGIRHVRLALPEHPLPAGEPAWLLQFCRLDGTSLAERIEDLVREPAHV